MFKKDIKIANKTKLSSKDRKKLKEHLVKYFDKESIEKLFMLVDEFYMEKVQGSKTVIYTDAVNPLFIDSTSKNDFFPTLYAMHLFPNICFNVKIKEGVEDFVLKGAKLMWPGVDTVDENDFKDDDVCAIMDSNSTCIAIGALATNRKAFEEKLKKEKIEGICAYILHFKGDKMWEMGDMIIKEPWKKPEFKENEEDDTELIDFDDLKKKGGDDVNYDDMMKFAHVKKKNKGQTTGKPITQKVNVFKDEEDKGKQKGNKKTVKKDKKNNDANEGSNNISKNVIDEMIVIAFKNACKLTLFEAEFPLEPSVLWSQHMIPCKPTEDNLDIKNSSYKKLGKFLQFLVNQKLIQYKESSKKNESAKITKINFNNPIIENWEPNIETVTNKKDTEKGDKPTDKFQITKNIIEICKPKEQIIKYLKDINKNEWTDHSVIISKFKEYLEDNKLINNNKVIINDEFKGLFSHLIDEPKSSDEEDNGENEHKKKKTRKEVIDKPPLITLEKKEVFKSLDKYLVFGYKEVDLVDSEKKEKITVGKFNGVEIITEFSHNKNITRITNLNLFGIKLNELSSYFNNLFATSSSIHDISGKTKGKEIIIQGDFGEEVKEFCINTLKISEYIVHLISKNNKKKKK